VLRHEPGLELVRAQNLRHQQVVRAVVAAIASLHADEPQNWPQIAALYGELARLTGSSVVELVHSDAERRFLERRLAECEGAPQAKPRSDPFRTG
jgi:hypothetical protein